MTEAQEQSIVFKWTQQPSIREKYPQLKLLYHVPNGGHRDPIEARHLKQQGVRAGVPDLCLPIARGGKHGLYIEMKTAKGRTSPMQEWWMRQLWAEGYAAMVCRSWQEATNVLQLYMDGML